MEQFPRQRFFPEESDEEAPEDLIEVVGKMQEGSVEEDTSAREEEKPGRGYTDEELAAYDSRRKFTESREEGYRSFKGVIDSILNLDIPGKSPEELKAIKLAKLEENRKWAVGLDKKFQGNGEALNYLAERMRIVRSGK